MITSECSYIIKCSNCKQIELPRFTCYADAIMFAMLSKHTVLKDGRTYCNKCTNLNPTDMKMLMSHGVLKLTDIKDIQELQELQDIQAYNNENT